MVTPDPPFLWNAGLYACNSTVLNKTLIFSASPDLCTNICYVKCNFWSACHKGVIWDRDRSGWLEELKGKNELLGYFIILFYEAMSWAEEGNECLQLPQILALRLNLRTSNLHTIKRSMPNGKDWVRLLSIHDSVSQTRMTFCIRQPTEILKCATSGDFAVPKDQKLN